MTGGRAIPAEAAAGTNEAAQQAAQLLIKVWIKDDAKAMYLMSAAMESTQMEPLISCTSSKAMWDRLAAIHEQRSASDFRNRSKCGIWRPSDEDRRVLLNTDQKDAWITDSGVIGALTFRRDWFTDYRPRRDGSTVVLGDNRQCEVAGEGTIRIERLADGVWKDARLNNVLHVPDMGKNLYSVKIGRKCHKIDQEP